MSSLNEVALTNKEKGELMVSTFVALYSCYNLTDEGKQDREERKR